MKKRNDKLLLAVLCVIAFALIGCGSLKKSKCTEVIENFEASCNQLDISGILNCIDPKISDPLKGIATIGDMFSSQDSSTYFLDIIDRIGSGLTNSIAGSDTSASELFSGIQIEPDKYKLKSREGTIICITTFQVNGMEIKKNIAFQMVKKNDSWYIAGLELISDK